VPELGPAARDARGDEHLLAGRFDAALADFEAFLAAHPGRAPHHWRRGIGLYYAGRYADGVAQFDDEDAFSVNYKFYCWDKVPTLEISNVFSSQCTGLGNIEYGWFELDVLLPARPGALRRLRRERGRQGGGGPAVRALHAVGAPPGADGLGRQQRDERRAERRGLRLAAHGRKPASLLLVPEFDNRFGVATVVTVTNTSPTEGVRTHWIYAGRYGN
jgi:hypothetical protein